MKRFIYEYLPAWILLMILGLVVLHAPLTVYVGTHWPSLAMGIKSWKEVLIIAALILVVIDVSQRRMWQQFSRDKLFWLVLAYVALHLMMLVIYRQPPAAILAGLAIDLRYVAYASAVYLYVKLYPAYIPSFKKIAIMGAVVVVGFAVLQLALPRDILRVIGYSDTTIAPYLTVDKNPDYVRVNSTLRGPNPLGAYAIIVLSGVVAAGMTYGHRIRDWRVKWLHLGLAVCGAVALWISYSRGAFVGAFIAIGILVVVHSYGAAQRISQAAWATLLLGTLLLACAGYLMRDTSFVHNVILHDNPTTGAAIDSNQGHADSLRDGVERMVRQPLGAGVGSTGSASLLGDTPLIIENQYLFIAHEVGWLGLVLFVLVFVAAMRRVWRLREDWLAAAVFASGIGLAVVGIVLPVWVDDTVSIVWWGLLALIVAKGAGHGTKTNQKTKRTA